MNPVFCSAQNLNDETGAYKTSNYRNLFKEKNYAEKEIDTKVEKAAAMFHCCGKFKIWKPE